MAASDSGIATGRGGGSHSPATGLADGPGLVVSVGDASGGLVAAQWAACDALTTGQPKAKTTLAPIVLDRTQTKGPLTIGVGYVAESDAAQPGRPSAHPPVRTLPTSASRSKM